MIYANLFELNPTLKTLFKGDMQEQGKKLMQMIGAAVGKLNDLETLVPILQGLGDAFTEKVKNAWSDVYEVMTDVMISASSREIENLHN